MASGAGEAVSPRLVMPIFAASSSRRRGPIDTDRPCGSMLRKRQEKLSEEVREIAWKAQHRLYARYRKLKRAREKQTASDHGDRA